ncbi:MAG: hypothetical protein J0L73_10075 [Verrucomicrobia bacterium]|nr:hypothetical protein [Verrucomicrobiota bacterium]
MRPCRHPFLLAYLLGSLVYMAAPATLPAETETREEVQEQVAAALQSHDWGTAYFVALKEMKEHPEEKFWADVVVMARLRVAVDDAPRIRQSPSQLSKEEQTKLQSLSKATGAWVSSSPEQRKTTVVALLSQVKSFATDHPDVPLIWIMQAQVCVVAQRGLEGRIAARNLEALRAWEAESASVLSLLGQLQVLGWMPATKATTEQRNSLDALEQQVQVLGLQKEGAPDKLTTLLSQIKEFCRNNENLPNGWLLQYHLAAKLGRNLDLTVARDRLIKMRTKFPGTPSP